MAGEQRREAVSAVMDRVRSGDVRALARAISAVENGGVSVAEFPAVERRSLRVGITGPPGAGKSTLVDQMVRRVRAEGRRVGVIAIDPSSPVTGGALLGDRIRMQEFSGDEGVFIRSMASRGAMGGVAAAAEDVCVVMEAAGFEVVLVETVGVGQHEVDVMGMVDVTVVVLVPGAGDEVQSMKAGVMEIADVFVVNKSDRGGAEQVEGEILAMQGLAVAHGEWVAPVVRTSALDGSGVEELMEVVERCAVVKKTQADLVGSAGGLKTAGVLKKVADKVNVGAEAGLRLDHLGIAVKRMDAARGFYEALGMRVEAEEIVAHEQVRTMMLPVGESRVELLEATAEDSTIGRFIAKRGEGLHHIALRVDDVDGMFARLRAEGVRLASDAVRVGAGGHRYFFVHPASTGGVLVELVSPQRADSPGTPVVGE